MGVSVLCVRVWLQRLSAAITENIFAVVCFAKFVICNQTISISDLCPSFSGRFKFFIPFFASRFVVDDFSERGCVLHFIPDVARYFFANNLHAALRPLALPLCASTLYAQALRGAFKVVTCLKRDICPREGVWYINNNM